MTASELNERPDLELAYDEPEAAPTSQGPQQYLEQSISRFPAISVGVAVATGVVLGCLIKRG